MKERSICKVSIITPTLNSAKDIAKCIESVAHQIYDSFEHIIIDGKSTDNTVKIIQEYQETYPNIFLLSEKDTGIYDAMNKGVLICNGEWVYFLGCDDYLINKNVLKTIFDNKKRKGKYSIIYGNVLYHPSGIKYAGKFNYFKLIKQNICHQAIFVKKSVFDVIGIFDTRYCLLADWDFNFKWFGSKKIKHLYIDENIAVYNHNGKSSNINDDLFWNNFENIIFASYPNYIIILRRIMKFLLPLKNAFRNK
jgi:glycosyltransferase involved in cell wall biosynthesis